MLYIDIIDFVKKVLRTRMVLIENNVSKLDKKETLIKIDYLSKLIDYYGYGDNKKASCFFINHHKEIEFLLPGSSSLAYTTFKDKYDELLERSFNYQNRHAVN
jgi:hypothetical protein